MGSLGIGPNGTGRGLQSPVGKSLTQSGAKGLKAGLQNYGQENQQTPQGGGQQMTPTQLPPQPEMFSPTNLPGQQLLKRKPFGDSFYGPYGA